MENTSFTNKLKKPLPLIALSLGFFMVIMDVNIVNIALPTISAHLKGGISWLQWVVDGYTLTFACFLLSAGDLGDRLGAKPAYLGGLTFFILTSLLCGLASTFLQLTIFRFLQGVSAALLVPTSLSLINSSYDSKQERARAIGVWGGLAGIAAACAPVVGAFLVAAFGWRSVFIVNIPIGIMDIFLVLKYVMPSFSKPHAKFDFSGQITCIIWVATLAFALIEAGRLGWSSGLVLSSFGIFFLFLIIFLWTEYCHLTPMFPLKFFKSKTFSISISVGMIINFGIFGLLFLLPLYFQHIRLYSVFITGLAIAPFTLLTGISSYLAGRIVSRVGVKTVVMLGLITETAGFFIMLGASLHSPYWIMLVALLLLGLGCSFTMPAVTIAAINSAPQERAGIASGAFHTSRQLGSLVGVAVFGTIIAQANNFIDGMHIALMVAGVLTLLIWFTAFWGISAGELVKQIDSTHHEEKT